MTDDIQVIPATSPEWAEWLAAVAHDFYHTAAYHRFSQACGEGEAFLAIYGDRAKFVAWPYLLRRVADSAGLESSRFTDVTSVYGYPGPLVCNCADDGVFLASAWEALVKVWRKQDVVTVFTRFHPVLENHQWLSGFCLTSCGNSNVPEAGLDLWPNHLDRPDAFRHENLRDTRRFFVRRSPEVVVLDS